MKSTRRSFLASAAGMALAAPFVRLLGPKPALAAPAQAKRLLVFFTPNGTIPNLWRPTGVGSSYRFGDGTMLEPLQGLENDLIVLSGLDFYQATNHEGGMGAMLTNGTGPETAGLSVDQFVARKLGAGTRLPSLELGVLTSLWGGGIQTRMSYGPGGALLTPDDDPKNAFVRLFGDSSGGEEAVRQLFERRVSLLDLHRDELRDLHGRLGVLEKRKMDTHLESLRALERQLEPLGDVCEPLAAPSGLDAKGNDQAPELLSAQIELAVQALACDLTRVASIQFSHTVSPTSFTWLGISEVHHSLSHAADGTAGVPDFVACEQWCAAQFATLINRLKTTPDPDGEGSLLDTTVVVWAKEMGDSRAHVCTDVPFILAGGGDAFSKGRHLDMGGISHAHLLVSICQALGLDNDTFGNPDAGRGPLSELS
ncbi:MAG: DUF1552 domain-containing protein [Myxococcota bacterium]